jgi:hypothetical protein
MGETGTSVKSVDELKRAIARKLLQLIEEADGDKLHKAVIVYQTFVNACSQSSNPTEI